MSYRVDKQDRLLGTARAGATLVTGDVALKNAAGYWVKADANDASLYPALGVVTEGASIGGQPKVASDAEISGYSGLTPGGAVYLSETAGGVTQTAPAIAQLLGYAVDDTTIRFEIRPVTGVSGSDDITDTEWPVKSGQTITDAIAAAGAGDYIKIQAGAYDEDIVCSDLIDLVALGFVTINGDVTLASTYGPENMSGNIQVVGGKTVTVGTASIVVPTGGMDLRRAVAGILSGVWSVGASNADFTSVQDAVDAAVAVYGATSNRQYVIDYTNGSYTPAEGVSVIPLSGVAAAAVNVNPDGLLGYAKINTSGGDPVTLTNIALSNAAETIEEIIALPNSVVGVTVPNGTRRLRLRTTDAASGDIVIYYDGDEVSGVPYLLSTGSVSVEYNDVPDIHSVGFDCSSLDGTNVLHLQITDTLTSMTCIEIWALGVAS